MCEINELNKQCLEAHNLHREDHQVEPLQFAEDLHHQAQAWAEQLASQDKLEHSVSDGQYGENVAMKFSSSSDFVYTGGMATDQWYSELDMYDFQGPENQLRCGHFSQVVWKSTREAGFGQARAASGKMYVVGQYRPPANFQNEWHANIFPSIKEKYVSCHGQSALAPKTDAGDAQEGVLTSQKTKVSICNGVKTITKIATYSKENGETYEVTTIDTQDDTE